ncbi:PREDICTED: maestro heat-like repeat-containing protein family member 1 isoform X1 [Papilio xuthus]|uniref:Maestro heat-like repeat-containing protein family member 1 isoform X1 n=1 Tax=Papilio xuthus TaxID=66420 RepID=A0AAJ6ZXP5_PAPXU|nr:PREDICTED: maestro heat-like repeat-containing protein family member 1 isoform X1 [Papilio xuthus]
MSATKTDCLQDTVTVLINAIGDSENSVNNVVIKSLTKIANIYPNEVIDIFSEFYKNSAKVNNTQLSNIVNTADEQRFMVLEQTCVNQVKKLNSKTATDLVNAMLRAMTENTAYEPVIQMGASSVLVAVSHEYLDMVLRLLINQLSPASVPHYAIVHTLGTLAAVNTHDVVPHIKEILSKMLPLLTLVKQDGVKQAFAYAFGHFAVAVAEQIGDNVENDNITSIKENFVTEFSIIFDVLYNQWLSSHEPKVSESILEALGPITRLISERQFNETVNKFVLSLLSLYRKPALNFYYISQCISYMLSPSTLNPKLTLNDNVITAINHAMFNLVLVEPDYDQPHTVKNHFEVLRCFDHMAGQFPEQTIEGLLHHCKNNQEKDRMKAVIILTHLTTSSQVFIDKYAIKFIAILKVMITMEQNVKMKKLLIKAIVGLVYRNCITTSEDFSMIEFIIKHCGYEGAANIPKHDILDLHDTCKSSLILMCNTVTSVRTQLRNLLLTALTVEEFTSSMTTVSHCLTSLLQNNSDVIVDEPTDKALEVKISADLVFVRCITHIVDPNEKEKNKSLLIFLEEYSGDVHKNLKKSWTVEIQRLLKFVDKNESRDQWHGMLLDMLVSAIEQVNSNKWVETIATLISQQVLSKKQSPMIKGVSLQYLAILSCHMSNAAAVEKVLKIILFSLKAIPLESCDYVSKAVGIASRQHGEDVMNELDAIYKENEAKRGSKIFNFLSPKSSKNETEISVVKFAAISCYGKVANECLDVHVLARLGENVTSILHETLKSNPPFDLCKASVTTLYEISKALQPASHHNITLRNRWQLLNAVLSQIYNSNIDGRNVELYPIIVKASKALTKLQKGILPEERNTILRVLFGSIFEELSSFKDKYEIDGNRDKNDLLAKTLNDSLTLLHQLIRELIIQSTCLSTIDDLVGLLMEWIRSENDEIRSASMLILQVVFDSYIKNVKLNYETPSKFGQMGYLLGILVPGVADTNFQVRLTTVDCIKLIIQTQDLYEGLIVEADNECMASLAHLQNNILTNDLNMISDYCTILCDTISSKIPHHHTMQFIESLLEGYDSQEYRSVGISAVLNALFMKKGQDLYQNIERIVEVMLTTMDEVNEDAMTRLLSPLTSLTRHHSNAVTAVLLTQKLPLKPSVMACWRCLASDESLSEAIIDNFLRLMTSIELYEDPYHVTETHIAALQPLTLISALGEMLQVGTMKALCIAKFSDMFTVLYTTLACYLEAAAPAYTVPTGGRERFAIVPNRDAIKLSPAKITVHTFNAFLDQADCQKVREACSLCLSVEHGEGTLCELAALLAGALAGPRLASCVARLARCARAPLPPQRCAAAALLANLLDHRCNEKPVLAETILATLSTGWKDENARVRAASLRGAANVARLPPALRPAALPAALSALSQGIDAHKTQSPIDNVPLAAIQGLSRLLTELETLDKEFDRELLSISQKIRPFMNTECAQLREASIRLFGIIASRVSSETLIEQAVSSLPCFLLHLCDNNPAVVRASKFTLREVFKTLKVKKSNDFVQAHLVDEGRLYLDEFLGALLRQLAEEMPRCVPSCLQAAVNYLHCIVEEMKPHPPLLLGLLYAELYRIQEKTSEDIDLDPDITKSAKSRLLQLIKDPNPAVRQNSALALANICLVCAHHG